MGLLATLALALLSLVALALLWLLWACEWSPALLGSMGELLHLLLQAKGMGTKARAGQATVIGIFEETVRKHPDVAALTMADTGASFTFRELDQRSTQVARWALGRKVVPGSTVALLMPNCVEYVALWLGFSKIGAVTALLNTNISGKALVHAIKTAVGTSATKYVVVGDTLQGLVRRDDVSKELQAEGVTVLLFKPHDPRASKEPEVVSEVTPIFTVDLEIDSMPTEPAIEPHYRANVQWDSGMFLIYTSGTTGLPKASKINQLRFLVAGLLIKCFCHLTTSDRIYCPLPLYHASGGMMGTSACLQSGAGMVLRNKFSVSAFARDIAVHKCTVMQYIGELARYLCAAKSNPLDGTWRLKYAIGNGMRPDVWEKFTRRYNIGKVVEFYAATEGNSNLVNNTGRVGVIGVVPWFAEWIYPVKLAKFDNETEQLQRDPHTGLCTRCKPGEVGQIMGLIKDNDPVRRFDGYTDKKATAKKIATDVFRKGDKYFASGDLVRQDSFGFIYWVDRIGDTFRWKGENVSTAEVASVLSTAVDDFADVNVYGVEVPGKDGRAGMAAVSLVEGATGVDWAHLYARLDKELPPYAQPLFIRLKGQLVYTTTFKHKKNELRDEGFDPLKMGKDEVFFRDPAHRAYVPMTSELYALLQSGQARV